MLLLPLLRMRIAAGTPVPKKRLAEPDDGIEQIIFVGRPTEVSFPPYLPIQVWFSNVFILPARPVGFLTYCRMLTRLCMGGLAELTARAPQERFASPNALRDS